MRYTCQKCEKKWDARQRKRPKVCPSCRTTHWQDYTSWKALPDLEPNELFESSQLGRMILLVNAIPGKPKTYAHYAHITEQAIYPTLARLRALGVAEDISSKGLNKNGEQITLPKEWAIKLEPLCEKAKAWTLQRIAARANREITRLQATEQLCIFDEMDEQAQRAAYRPRKDDDDATKTARALDRHLWQLANENLEKNRLRATTSSPGDKAQEEITIPITSAAYVELRQQLIAQITQRRDEQLRTVEEAFRIDRFGGYLKTYFYAFYPDIAVPLSEMIEYYVQWGDLT